MVDAPPRYSIFDRDFDPELGCRLRITLNGVEQTKVTAYDIEAGWLDRHEVDEAGNVVIDREREDMSIERVSGSLVVTLNPVGES